MRKILFLLLILLFFVGFSGKINARCGQKLPGNVGGCAHAVPGSPFGSYDCQPQTGLEFCCNDLAECQAQVAAAAPGAGPCANIPGAEQGQCLACFSQGKVWTALGCVETDPTSFIAQVLEWVMGIGGGIAFLLIVLGGFKVLTSGGDPEHLNEGKDIIMAAVSGLLLIIFSVILLRIIGVDILQIPGFSR